jgi:Threonine aldolase
MIDLRSDTVTKPSKEMRRAMERAEVGDDVYGEDPTANLLQERVAEIFGFEASLFAPSGTMCNEIAVKIHTKPGDEVILEESCHIFNHEQAMMAAFAGVLARPMRTEHGWFTVEDVKNAIRPKAYYLSRTGLICLENTHNAKGGAVYPQHEARRILEFAEAQKIPVHLDGSRIFNASGATGQSVKKLCAGFDSVMFCLSKGLGAPVGSMLLGDKAFIEEARRVRRMLGGGMRQMGVLAAAGLHALEHNIERLTEDHENAKLLAQKIAEVDGIELAYPVETNIVIIRVSTMSAAEFVEKLKAKAVLAGAVGSDSVRLVTHLDVSRSDILKVAEVIREVLRY